MAVISISNRRGGTGKTVTCHALGAGLAQRGYKVLFVDLDSQANLTFDLDIGGAGNGGAEIGSFELLKGKQIPEIVWTCSSFIDLIPGTEALALADREFEGAGLLRKALQPVREKYDYIIIDTPPALGVLTVNALTASDFCIVPVQAEIHSLQGVSLLYGAIRSVQQTTNPALTVSGILLTRYNPRAILSRDMLENFQAQAEALHTIVFPFQIRECIAIKEAQAMQQDIFTYAPASNAAADYSALVDAIEKQTNQRKKNRR